MKTLVFATLAALTIAGQANAAPVLTENFDSIAYCGSFDGQSTSDRFGTTDYYNTAEANGWTFTGYTHIAVDPTTNNGALHLNEAANGRADGVATRTVTLAANTFYTLSFLLSGDNRPGEAFNFIASIGNNTFTTAGVDGQSGANPGNTYRYGFLNTVAGDYTLTLSQSVTGGSGASPIVDNLSLAGVPEPASWAMMIAGFGLAGGALRRRKLVVRFA